MPVDQLRDFVLRLVEQDMINLKVTKRDVEGFLSAFSYNAYGMANINGISQLVYTRDDQIPDKLAERKWANPPPCDVNKDIPIDTVKSEDMHNSKIKKLMNQMEDKIFNGRVKMYHMFRQFDQDRDGYVSHQDFQKMLSSLKMDVSTNEVASMMKLIDKNNQGYLTFTDFSKVFSPSMSTNLVSTPLTDNYKPNVQPSEEMNTMLRETQKDVHKRIDDIRAMFKPP